MAVQTITYGDKQYLNQNADIPATNKVQDTDMNEIKEVVNNNASETSLNKENINNIMFGEKYSTSETQTNKVWIDNSPIYRKIIYVSSINCTTAGFKYVAHGITNLKNIISCDFREQVATSGISSSYSDEILNSVITGISFNNANIRIYTNAWNNISNWYFILEYTKTS